MFDLKFIKTINGVSLSRCTVRDNKKFRDIHVYWKSVHKEHPLIGIPLPIGDRFSMYIGSKNNHYAFVSGYSFDFDAPLPDEEWSLDVNEEPFVNNFWLSINIEKFKEILNSKGYNNKKCAKVINENKNAAFVIIDEIKFQRKSDKRNVDQILRLIFDMYSTSSIFFFPGCQPRDHISSEKEILKKETLKETANENDCGFELMEDVSSFKAIKNLFILNTDFGVLVSKRSQILNIS